MFKLKGNYLKLHIDSAVVRTELKVEKISEKLENWFTQPFENFVSEVKKQKGGFKDLSQQMEWQSFFKENQTKAVALQNKIKTTDAEIDELVFGLYDLTTEEIAIVRGHRRDNGTALSHRRPILCPNYRPNPRADNGYN